MKWMKERDLLIAQTMAFVQSVTGKKPDADALFAKPNPLTAAEALKPAAEAPRLAAEAPRLAAEAPKPAAEASKPAEAPASLIPNLEALLADTTIAIEPPRPAEIARPDARVDVQAEIRARVANFRAHQQRFSREREAYCSTTMAKVHASIRDHAQPPRLAK